MLLLKGEVLELKKATDIKILRIRNQNNKQSITRIPSND